MSGVTNEIIDTLVQLGLLKSSGTGGVTPASNALVTVDANNNTVLVGAGGTEFPLTARYVTTLGLAATSAVLTNGTAIPWDTVIQDDLAIADLTNNPTKIYIPDTVRMIRFVASCAFVSPVTGTAQAGGASTITLAAGASATDSAYNGQQVWIRSGTGAGQVRDISGYVGATKVATISAAWAVQPDATSTYAVIKGTYRGILPSFSVDGGAFTTGMPRQVFVPVLPVTLGNYEAIVQSVSRLIDITGWNPGLVANDNYVELKVQHDYGSGLSVYGASTYPSFMTVEMYE